MQKDSEREREREREERELVLLFVGAGLGNLVDVERSSWLHGLVDLLLEDVRLRLPASATTERGGDP
jgi:hypothetical protein